MDISTVAMAIEKLGAKAYVCNSEPESYSLILDGFYIVWLDENIACPTLEEFATICLGCDLSCCKTKQKSTIQNSWQEEVNAGFTYDENTFDFDDTTLGIVSARLAYNESVNTPTTADLTFYDKDKNAVVFQNKQAFKEFCISFISGRDEKDKKRIQKKININNAQSQEDVEAVTW